VDKTARAGCDAGLGEGQRPANMHGGEIVAGVVLQRSGAIDDRVDADEQRPPILGARHGAQVPLDPFDFREPSAGCGDVASKSDDGMAVFDKARCDVGADQPVAAKNKDTHAR